MKQNETNTAEREAMRAAHLRNDLFIWVLDTFRKNKYLLKQKFNISIYSDDEKRAALDELTELNFRYQVSNNSNSLEVLA